MKIVSREEKAEIDRAIAAGEMPFALDFEQLVQSDAEAGYTPQQIQAMTGAQYMSAYQNPYEQQVVQGTLADIERQRQISQQAQQARATGARAFGGSRQAVAEAIANEDYMRQAANTAA